jgi:hypothetical protein
MYIPCDVAPAEPGHDYTEGLDHCFKCDEALFDEAWIVSQGHEFIGISCRECVAHEVKAYEELEADLQIIMSKSEEERKTYVVVDLDAKKKVATFTGDDCWSRADEFVKQNKNTDRRLFAVSGIFVDRYIQ